MSEDERDDENETAAEGEASDEEAEAEADEDEADEDGASGEDEIDQTVEESALHDRDGIEDETPVVTGPKLKAADATSKAAAKSGGRSKLVGNLVFVLGFVATLVLGYFVGQWVRVKFGEKPEPESAERYRVELRGDEPQKGPDDALVTIIEFADFQCPYCAQSVEPLHDAMDSYEGDVRLIFKHYPLPGHRAAAPAAYASWAAHQQGDFWFFHDHLFEDKASIEHIPEYVRERSLDANKFGADMESGGARNDVDADMLAGSKVGVTGTPAFFVNGHLYRGKRDAVSWRKIIEVELDYAKEVVDDGVARADLYEHLMKDALTRKAGAPDGPREAKPRRRPGEPDTTTVYKIPIEGRPAQGPDNALVTIVEFADYHCPYCSKVKTDLDRLLEEHPDHLRLVYVQRPLGSLHPNAREASKAAVAAGKQGKFWEMHDKLFLRRLETMDDFVGAAQDIGLDVEQFKADFESDEVAEALVRDQKLAETFGINGTPAFFINGRYVSGALGYYALEGLFQDHLGEAQQMVSTGIAPSELYAKLMASAATEVTD